jgi:hypothetical protein
MGVSSPIPPLSSPPDLTLSVVSHGQWGLVRKLLSSLAVWRGDCALEVWLTLNLDEQLDSDFSQLPFFVGVLKNANPQGFAANHNQAFSHAKGRFFAVVNPDIVLTQALWGQLIEALSAPGVGVVAPRVVSPQGNQDDSARRFPTPAIIAAKARGRAFGPDYDFATGPTPVDWVGGMFMVFRREVYAQMGGFDTRYFLYYEDVDLCARLRLAGYQVLVCDDATVVHDAQRCSHRSWRYMRWHLRSMWRFFTSDVYRQLRRRGLL